jgi:hypothetical protein
VKFMGVDELHAAFVGENRTLGRILGPRTENLGLAVQGTSGSARNKHLGRTGL